MRIPQLIAIAGTALLPWTIATDVRGSVAPNSIIPLAPDSKAVLNNGLSGEALVRFDGSFLFRDVAPGKYILTVQSREYSFPSVAVEVPSTPHSGEAAQPVQVRSYKIGHISASPETVPTLPYPIVLQTLGQRQYYDVPKAFNLLTLIQQNKMILIMVAGLAFAIGMPKLLAMIDPEALKEVQQSQAEMHKTIGSAQNVDIAGSLSKFLAGGSQAPNKPPAAPAPAKRQGKAKAS